MSERMPLPTELELAETLGVSRPTVREALVRLEAEGLIARRPHQGTFPNVIAADVPFRIDQSYEITERLSEAGYAAQVDVLSAGWSTLSAEEAADLGADVSGSCFRVVKRWLHDGLPLAVAEDVVPAQRRDDVSFESDFSVFDVVERLRGTRVEWESVHLTPVVADDSAVDRLAVTAGTPLLHIRVVGASLHGDRLYRASELHTQRGPSYGMVRRAAWDPAEAQDRQRRQADSASK